MHQKFSILTIALATCLAQIATAQSYTREQLHKRIDSIISGQMGNNFPSITVAIVIDGKLDYKQAYGYADKEKKIAATTSTCYQIGSVTKTFTGSLLAKFITTNRIFLFDSVQKYFPPSIGFPRDSAGKPVTIVGLANHTAAIPRYPANLIRQDGDPILGYTHDQLNEAIRTMDLTARTGSRWDYSNFGYAILGRAMEYIENKSLRELFDHEIFIPLGMSNSSLKLTDKIRAKLATPYRDDDPNKSTVPWDMGALSAAGNIFSNVEDLAKFMIYQIEEKDAASKLQHQSFFQINEATGYGLGCFTGFSRSKNTRVIYHGGDVDGYAADMNFLPDKKMGVVILTNCGNGRAFSQISGAVFNEVFNFIK